MLSLRACAASWGFFTATGASSVCVERVQKPATGKEAPEYPLRTATDTGSRGGTGDDGDGIPEVGQARGDHADRRAATTMTDTSSVSQKPRIPLRECCKLFSALQQKRFCKASALQEKVDEVLALRRKADFAASHQLSVYGKAAENLDLAKKHLHNRRMALEGATNQTDQLEKDLLAAIQAEAMANESLRATKVWQKEFNASLQLERKEETLVEAKHEEDKKAAAKAEVSKHEARMRTLLETHKRHLALLDTQVELPQKDKAKAEAKIAFDAAEKNVVEAQSKLDGLVKTEAETHVKISETYEELNRLKIEHTEAEREYQDQDPEDRKRSFTTSLQ
ncbi:Hypothetical protein SCF082_LOCUS19165 [Durusdinium trenchii]|uniref:Uncharacterized protein n=1 Tax=Durusdinium trenchii TaxID=1381693 RepID=A0ABP0KV89_9DINO